MIHHYMTTYREGGRWKAEAWLQLNIFGRCYCFSKRTKDLGEAYLTEA